MIAAQFINPHADFGFKYLFWQGGGKEIPDLLSQ